MKNHNGGNCFREQVNLIMVEDYLILEIDING